MDYAKAFFKLGERQADGQTLKVHLEALEKQTGIRRKELDLPEFPVVLSSEWDWFLDLHASRQNTGFGIQGLSNLEVWAYFQLMEYKPAKKQVEVIRLLDLTIVDVIRAREKQK